MNTSDNNTVTVTSPEALTFGDWYDISYVLKHGILTLSVNGEVVVTTVLPEDVTMLDGGDTTTIGGSGLDAYIDNIDFRDAHNSLANFDFNPDGPYSTISTTIITSGSGWTMETAPGQAFYNKKRPKNTEKELTIDFENVGDTSADIKLSCIDLEGDGCKFISFDEEEFTLALIKDTKLRKTFKITTDDIRGDYRFNIVAIDDSQRTGAITVDLQVGGLGLLAVFYKIGLNSTSGVPYAVVFFPVLILIFILFYSKVLEKVPVRSIWSMLIAFLIASGSIAFW
jgi:hypothetical protein